MKKDAEKYENLLKQMVEKRKGAYDTWLDPQVLITAQCWVMLDKVFDELIDKKELTEITFGSTGQQKTVVSPLLDYYLKAQRTMIANFEALGLNFGAQPVKVDGAKPTKGEDNIDPMTAFIQGLNSK